MTPERWHQVNGLFHSALGREPAQRAAFLDQACDGDPELRKEVESLIGSHEDPDSFIDVPALEAAAQSIAEDPTGFTAGQRIGHYKIISLLGSGGMGEVYLAQDSKLGRKVALKLLPASFTQVQERVRRFEQEARAASALNHPNILTIHEVDEVDGIHFIATEYIEGDTLRQRITERGLKPGEAIDVAIEVAGALAAAHHAGIIHRDIKPENIMVRSDGYVKVLDFGLAKLTEREPTVTDTQSPTIAAVKTHTGAVMGTAHYMSPEQARGVAVDERTDIFSLGVVIYEMVTAHMPFEGETTSHVIVSILEEEPPPLTDYFPKPPAELQGIISKALSKNREERYQAVKDLLIDLKSLRQQPDLDASTKAVARTGRPVAPTTSKAKYLLTEIKKYNGRVFTALALVCGGLAYAIYHFASPTKPVVVHFQNMKIARVTNQGNVGQAAISPDGKYMTYVVGEGGKNSLWTKDLLTDGQTQIVPSVAAWLRPNTFTHDGRYVYYIRNDAQNPQGALYQMPFLGGPSKKILSNIECPISLSPDGKQFSFYREYVEANENELLVANADGTNERHLLRPKLPIFMSPRPAGWSPDGKMLAVGYGSQEGGDHIVVALVSVADGTLKLMPTPRWSDIGSIVWFSDGSGLVLQVKERDFYGKAQIWQVSYPGGEARQITNDLSSYEGNLTLTADGKTIMAVQAELVSNIWIAQDGETNSAHMIASGRSVQAGLGGVTWTPDGRVVYGNNIESKKAVWIVNADGSDPKPMTDGTTSDHLPEITADGRYMVFISTRTETYQLWRMDIDSGNLKQLTDGRNGIGMSCITSDGRWVVYSPFGGVDGGIWKVSIDGGNPIKLIEKSTAGYPQVSPEGKLLACHFDGDATKIIVTTFDNGSPVKTVNLPETSFSPFRWSHDGRALIYIDTRQGVSNLWSQPLDGSAPRQITDFKSDVIYQFAPSRDGHQLALARGNGTSDAVLISDSK